MNDDERLHNSIHILNAFQFICCVYEYVLCVHKSCFFSVLFHLCICLSLFFYLISLSLNLSYHTCYIWIGEYEIFRISYMRFGLCQEFNIFSVLGTHFSYFFLSLTLSLLLFHFFALFFFKYLCWKMAAFVIVMSLCCWIEN